MHQKLQIWNGKCKDKCDKFHLCGISTTGFRLEVLPSPGVQPQKDPSE